MQGKTIRSAVMVAHGGVGDFLWQLDLAKRLELAGLETKILVRKAYPFLSQIAAASDAKPQLVRADGARYALAIAGVWARALGQKTILINSFHFTRLRAPTKLFYAIARLCSARVLVCQRSHTPAPYEGLLYKDQELIWQRNNRIVEYVTGSNSPIGFPVLVFEVGEPLAGGTYLHIHPVASALSKSYPPEHLAEALGQLVGGRRVLVTMTPDADRWYLTDELRSMLEKNSITFIDKFFSFKEIAGLVAGADVFVTVNTGLLWLALMLGKKVVVCDIATEYEWNPAPYGALRLEGPTGAELARTLS